MSSNLKLIDERYSKFVKIYFFSFLGITLLSSIFLVRNFYLKNRLISKLTEIQQIRKDAKFLDDKINASIKGGYLNLNSVFIDFGDFHDDVVQFVGFKSKLKLDSLARVGGIVKYFDVAKEEKHQLEIIHYLEKMDDLLLSNDENAFYVDPKNKTDLNEKGKGFIQNWEMLEHFLSRALKQSEDDTIDQIDSRKRNIYNISIISILLLVMMIFLLLFIYYFEFLLGVYKIFDNMLLLRKGLSPDSHDFLKGELARLNQEIRALYRDFVEANSALSKLYSDEKLSIDELELMKENFFFDTIKNLQLQVTLLQENEMQRNWNLNGVSMLTDIVNKYSGNSKELFQQFLLSLVKYVSAVQGGIFVKETEEILVLETSYAFDRLKKRDSVINKGEGLIGEVWDEEKMQYIENVPSEHFAVKSSLGESKPSSVMLVPMIDRGECFGVLEIAFFDSIDVSRQDFLIKACEILAAATSNIKVNQKTKNLLRDSQNLAGQLKKQEDDNLKIIRELNLKIEQEKQMLFKKDVEIKSMSLKLDELRVGEKNLLNEINLKEKEFTKQLVDAGNNSETVQALQSEMNVKENRIKELEQMIHVRDVKIDNMKKKIDRKKEE